jgi:crossover junction endodeoxyribonuclease RusA
VTFAPLRFALPWPPSMNHLYPTNKLGRRFLSKRGAAYHEAVAVELLHQRIPRDRLDGRIALSLYLSPPDKRRRDISNLVKCLEDALTSAGVWVDDCQVDDLHVRRCEVCEGGRVLVLVAPFSPLSAPAAV